MVEFAPNQWFVDATPVTTTQAGLDFILDGVEPDLVISGINEGENVGASIAISSGTVSAATTATRAGIPAIAVSAGTLRDPQTFAIDEEALAAAYDFSAKFVVDLVAELIDRQGTNPKLLPDGVGLNVNIPAVVENIEGTALTVLDETGTFDLFVGDRGDGPRLLFSPSTPLSPEQITVANSEGQNFLGDFVTVTPVDGDWTASDAVRQSVSDRFTAAPEDAVATPLNILLTNDDGIASEGLAVLYTTLTAAGHTVTVVAPQNQQSGTGTALDSALIGQPLQIAVVDNSDFTSAQWFVNAGVRTTTWAGLDLVLNGEDPDLVLSGINAGENIGPGGAVSSGTVSAAVTALLRDVPAIAVSGGIDFTTFDTPTETYQAGADFIVELIAKLQATQGTDPEILPDGLGLSVNIPSRFPEGVTEIQGVAFTNASDTSPILIGFGDLDGEPGGDAGVTFSVTPTPTNPDPLSEGDQFLSGFITVTPIDGDWTADGAGQEAIVSQLAPYFEPPSLVSGTPGPDILLAGVENSAALNGLVDLIFTGAGNDEVDTAIAPAPAGENRIFTGSGSDVLTVTDGDRAFGGSGADLFEATDASGYRLSGGAGDDQFFLGVGGRALGGDGNDTFFVGEGGDNLLSGGAGADVFRITSGELPASANTIVDFTLGTDLLGLIGYTFAELSFSGSDILIGNETIATLVGVNAETLTVANFA